MKSTQRRFKTSVPIYDLSEFAIKMKTPKLELEPRSSLDIFEISIKNLFIKLNGLKPHIRVFCCLREHRKGWGNIVCTSTHVGLTAT